MKKAIIKEKKITFDGETFNFYSVHCEDSGNMLLVGQTSLQDCIEDFHKLNLPDYGLYRQVNSR